MAILELITATTFFTPATWVVSVLTFVLFYILLQSRRPANLPPGPPSLPLVGSLPFIDYKALNKDINSEARNISKKYGDICHFYVGRKLVVILDSYDSIKEAFVSQGVNFAGRTGEIDPSMQACNPYHPVLGMTYSSYSPEWKKQRHLSIAIMRSLGWGKNGVEEQIQDECGLLIENLRTNGAQPLNPKRTIGVSSSNIICGLLFGSRYSHDDLEFKKLLQQLDDYFENRFSNVDKKHVPFIKYFSKSWREGQRLLEQYSKGIYELSQKKMSEGRARLDAGEEPRDFIMHYLQELEKDGSGSRISDDWLGPLIRDFFSAGTETTTTTLTWAMLYLATHTHVQDKIHEEIDAEFGCGEHRFSLGEKERLPYTEASLAEIQRLASIASFSIPHTTIRDVNFRGYTIPNKTVVLANLYSVSTDERLWGKTAMQFIPERFIDADTGTLSKPEYWIPYSMGRRMCLGEQLAKQELFLFFSHIVHAFRVTVDPACPEPSLQAQPGAGVRSAQPFKVVFTPRF